MYSGLPLKYDEADKTTQCMVRLSARVTSHQTRRHATTIRTATAQLWVDGSQRTREVVQVQGTQTSYVISKNASFDEFIINNRCHVVTYSVRRSVRLTILKHSLSMTLKPYRYICKLSYKLLVCHRRQPDVISFVRGCVVRPCCAVPRTLLRQVPRACSQPWRH